MIVVTVPDEENILATQEREGAFYFSVGAESIVRRCGIVNVSRTSIGDLDLTDPRRRPLLTRMVAPTTEQLATIAGRASAFEAPLDDAVLAALGLRGEVVAVDRIDLCEPDGRARWVVRRSETTVLSPETGGDVPLEDPGAWQQPRLLVQLIDGPIDEVRFVGRLSDGRQFPAVFRTGKAWICALPVFDLGVEFLTFPPLPARWNNRHTMSRFEEMGQAIIEDLAAHLAADRGMPVVKVDNWPQGYANAMCVRHDYDRAISDDSLRALLDFYDRRGLVSAIGFLSYELPPDQVRALAAHGHEIQIHVWQPDVETFLADVAALSEIAGAPVVGATAHGNERGFRGDAHYDWFEQAGIEYAELFRISDFPAPIYRLGRSGVLQRSSLMGTPGHFSLDANSSPEEHRLDGARRGADVALQAGTTVIPMNHPDINRAALYELLDELGGTPLTGRLAELSGPATWRASLRDIVRWTRLTRHDTRVAYGDDHLSLEFPSALPLPLEVAVDWGSGKPTIYTAAAGDRVLSVPMPKPRRLDARLNAQSKVRSYQELVEALVAAGLVPRTFSDDLASKSQPRTLLLRHDVDNSLDNALMLSRVEAEIGICSTYFMLHPGDGSTKNYYGTVVDNRIVHAPGFFDACHEIASRGHEIGLHYDMAQLSYRTGRPIGDLIADELAAFAEHGLPIAGCAAHGSGFAVRDLQFSNFEIFRECVRGAASEGRMLAKGDWQLQLHQLSLKDFGLKYEAYFVPRNIYISDSNGRLRVSWHSSSYQLNVEADGDLAVVDKTIGEFAEPRIQALLHPCWWELVR